MFYIYIEIAYCLHRKIWREVELVKVAGKENVVPELFVQSVSGVYRGGWRRVQLQ